MLSSSTATRRLAARTEQQRTRWVSNCCNLAPQHTWPQAPAGLNSPEFSWRVGGCRLGSTGGSWLQLQNNRSATSAASPEAVPVCRLMQHIHLSFPYRMPSSATQQQAAMLQAAMDGIRHCCPAAATHCYSTQGPRFFLVLDNPTSSPSCRTNSFH